MSPVCKMADNGLLTLDQMVKVVLFYAETKSVVATERRFRAHFGTRWAPCKQTIYRLSLESIFQSMRINSVPDVKCFCKKKNVLCVQSMVWHFVRHPVYVFYPSHHKDKHTRYWSGEKYTFMTTVCNIWPNRHPNLSFCCNVYSVTDFEYSTQGKDSNKDY